MFQSDSQPPLSINLKQHKKWLDRTNRLANKLTPKRFKPLLNKPVALLNKRDVQTRYRDSEDSESEEAGIDAFQTKTFDCTLHNFVADNKSNYISFSEK